MCYGQEGLGADCQGGPPLTAMGFGSNQSTLLLAVESPVNPLCMKLPVIEAGQDLEKWCSTKSALSCTSLFTLC